MMKLIIILSFIYWIYFYFVETKLKDQIVYLLPFFNHNKTVLQWKESSPTKKYFQQEWNSKFEILSINILVPTKWKQK